jgi:hypothetical protein
VLRDVNGSFDANVVNATNLSGGGTSITSINASNLSTGTVPVARVSGSYTGITGVGTVTAGTWQGNAVGVVYGGTGTSTQFTAGSVVFAGTSGVYSQDNSNLFWDDSNNRLGIGTTSPAAPLHVNGENIIVDRNAGDPYYTFYTGGVASNVSIYGGSSNGFRVFTGGTERMRIDSSGNVGIGTTSPTSTAGFVPRLQLNASTSPALIITSTTTTQQNAVGTDGNGLYIETVGNATATNNNIIFRTTATNSSYTGVERMRITSAGNLLPGADSTYNFGASGSRWLTVNANTFSEGGAANNFITTSSTTTLFNSGSTWQQAAFYTAGGERMRIDSSGNVGIGTTSPATKTEIQGGAETLRLSRSTAGSVYLGLAQAGVRKAYLESNNNDLNLFAEGASSILAFGTVGAERGRFSSTGGFSVGTTSDPGAGAIYATGNITAFFSDQRLKTVSGKIENALDKVKSLSGVYYTMNDVAKANGYDSDETQVGVLAQEVEAVLPEIVKAAPFDLDEHGNSKSGENYKTVQYEKLVPLLIEAIKELKAEVDALKGK